MRLGSSIIAHSSPFISTPARRSGSTRRGSLSSCSSPSAFASRLAGSIVTTATLSPRAAIPTAIAAEVVVLPTPPAPTQMQMRSPSSSCGLARSSRELLRQQLQLRELELRREQVGQRQQSLPERVAQALLPARRSRVRARVFGERDAHRRAPP